MLLTLGFFVCGFQVVFVGVHLPSYLLDKGLPAYVGVTALMLIGLFNIFGTYISGWLGGRISKKYILSAIYFARALATVVPLPEALRRRALRTWAPCRSRLAPPAPHSRAANSGPPDQYRAIRSPGSGFLSPDGP